MIVEDKAMIVEDKAMIIEDKAMIVETRQCLVSTERLKLVYLMVFLCNEGTRLGIYRW